MNFRKQNHYLHPAGFNITPLIDILLVLIIFFILTWNFSRDEKELSIRVPSAKQGLDSKPRPGEIILNVMPDGSILLNRRTLETDALAQVLQRVAKEFPEQAVILRADQGVPYKHIIHVLDVCRAAGIWNVAFATAKETK